VRVVDAEARLRASVERTNAALAKRVEHERRVAGFKGGLKDAAGNAFVFAGPGILHGTCWLRRRAVLAGTCAQIKSKANSVTTNMRAISPPKKAASLAKSSFCLCFSIRRL
jgi:hypothetical protein